MNMYNQDDLPIIGQQKQFFFDNWIIESVKNIKKTLDPHSFAASLSIMFSSDGIRWVPYEQNPVVDSRTGLGTEFVWIMIRLESVRTNGSAGTEGLDK